jgi:hypothetical protein
MASLTVVVEGVEQRIPLESASVTLGRGLESDVRLKDIKASRRHCQVVKTPKGYQCVDLSSGNGTYVNGVQIKAQMLSAGDKITIGSTTILFQEAAKAVVPSKAATGKVPVAAPAPVLAPSKTATAKMQVAPTRRTTSRIEAVAKPSSQQALKPAGSKSGTRLGRASGRTPVTRPPRGPAEAPKKKSPALIIAGALVLAGLAGGGFFLFRGKDNGEEIRTQVDRLVKKAHDEEAAGKVDAAIQDYKKALELCQGDMFKIKARDIAKLLAQLEAPRPPAPAVKPDSKDPAPEKGPDAKARRAEIHQKYKLAGDDAAADWGGALKEWNDFLGKKPAAEAASLAQEDLRAIQGKAKADLDRLRKRADGLAQENKMAEAVSLLKQQLPRFEGTEVLPDLEAAIKRYDR